MEHPCYTGDCRSTCRYGYSSLIARIGRNGRLNSADKRRKNLMNQIENSTPWEDPKVQMMIQMFNGVITAVTPLNIREVHFDGTTR